MYLSSEKLDSFLHVYPFSDNRTYKFMRHTIQKIFFLILALTLLGFIAQVEAATVTSVQNGDWSDPCTWSATCDPAAMPTINDDVVINHDVVVDVDVTVNSINIFRPAGGGGGTRELTINADVTLTTIDDFIAGNQSDVLNNGLLIVGGDIFVSNNGNINGDGTGLLIVLGCPVKNGNTNIENIFGSADSTAGNMLTYCFVQIVDDPTNCTTGDYGYTNLPATHATNCGTLIPILPIELTFFEATLQKDPTQDAFVALHWATAAEKDNSHFELQRSTNGRDFTTIGQVLGTNQNQTTFYQYKDYEFQEGRNYYRLLQVDYDGKMSYSPIVQVWVVQKSRFVVYPNPATDYFFVESNNFSKNLHLNLLDSKGQQVAVEVIAIGIDRFKIVPTEKLSKGLYLLRYLSKEGHYQSHKILVE